jgi:hypothetical protein
MKPHLSVILPVSSHNDSLPLIILDIDRAVSGFEFETEIILAKNGVDSEFESMVKKLSETIKNLKLVKTEEILGLTVAVRQAVLLASGDFRLIADPENSIPVDQFSSAVPYLKSGIEVLIGHRVKGESSIYDYFKVQYIKEVFTKLFLRTFVFKKLQDPLCPFLIFKEQSAEAVFQDLKSESDNLFLEVLRVVKKNGFNIAEFPILT